MTEIIIVISAVLLVFIINLFIKFCKWVGTLSEFGQVIYKELKNPTSEWKLAGTSIKNNCLIIFTNMRRVNGACLYDTDIYDQLTCRDCFWISDLVVRKQKKMYEDHVKKLNAQRTNTAKKALNTYKKGTL